MPNLGNVSIWDVVPAERTYKPDSVKNGVATYFDRSGGIPAGYGQLTVSHVNPSKTSRNSKSRFKLHLPRLDAEGAVVSQVSADITFLCDDKSTDEDRENLKVLMASLLSNPACTLLVIDNESMY